jgi:hypothetical protein
MELLHNKMEQRKVVILSLNESECVTTSFFCIKSTKHYKNMLKLEFYINK